MDESLLPKELQTKKNDAPQKANKAIVGTARVKKPSIQKKFKDVFMTEDIGSVREYIIWDQIIPALIDGIYNTVMGTLSMMFYGKIRGTKGNGPRRSNQNWQPGTQFSYDQVNNRRPSIRDGGYFRRPNSATVDEIVVDTYNDAAAVLEELIAYLEQYGRVPISAYYDAFGVTDNRDWTNVRWGWTTLNTAKVVPVRGGGYTVDLPNPEPL